MVNTEDAAVADSCVFSDNCLDLVPGDEQVVNLRAHGGEGPPAGGWKIKSRRLGLD